MGERERWLAEVTPELGIDPQLRDGVTDPILDMVRDIARGINRPSGPLTAFMIGLAVGIEHDNSIGIAVTPADVQARIDQVNGLIARWVPEFEDAASPKAIVSDI